MDFNRQINLPRLKNVAEIHAPCTACNGGYLTITGSSMGVNELKLADGDEGSANMNARMSGGVQY